MSVKIAAFVQARMSSRRFPGKVLAPFRGQPIIRHVVSAIASALPDVPIVVVTSRESSDDPLAVYVETILGRPCFRGPLDDVIGRFRLCLDAHPCDWILRICADSPLLNERVLQGVTAPIREGKVGEEVALVTTTAPRTFPKGQNAEVIRARALLAIDPAQLTDEDREHVTRYFHRLPEQFGLLNIESGDPTLASLSFVVDTIEDLHRLEATDPSALAAAARTTGRAQ